MKDQASTLRFMASSSASAVADIEEGSGENKEMTRRKSGKVRYIAITGGKGGVGKSNLSVNLSLELGMLGKKVGLIDADFGLANADLLCGVSPKFHLGHVIKSLKDLDDIKVAIDENVTLIPGGSGFEDLANMSRGAYSYLLTKLREMEESLDFMIIDTAAGIAENVSGVLISAEEIIVVVTPEPTSIVDAYATVKLILRHSPDKKISIVVNSVVGIGDAERVFLQIHAAARGFLSHELEFLGAIPQDQQLVEAVREQTPVVKHAPNCPASRAIRMIARQMQNRNSKEAEALAQTRSFWEALKET